MNFWMPARSNHLMRRSLCAVAVLLCAAVLPACHLDMWNQPKLQPLQPFDFFEDGRASRQPVEGTVTYDGKRRGWSGQVFTEATGERNVPPLTDLAFWTGKTPEGFLEDNYFDLSLELILRGRERYTVSCMPCHGSLGDGRGIIVQRGFQAPPTFHSERLRGVEDGYIFDIITHGFGRMYSQAPRVTPEDRWAIAAYIRGLQASQDVDITDPDDPLVQEIEEGIAARAQGQPIVEHGIAAGHHVE